MVKIKKERERKKMKTILSEIPALRNFYKASCIDKGFMYASDSEVLKKAKESFTFWMKV